MIDTIGPSHRDWEENGTPILRLSPFEDTELCEALAAVASVGTRGVDYQRWADRIVFWVYAQDRAEIERALNALYQAMPEGVDYAKI